MKQVFSQRGRITVEDVPAPLCRAGGVLVRTAWSLLSSGTERTDIAGQKLLDRLRRRPEDVSRAWDLVKRTGLTQAVSLARDRLERPIVLGNSLAGVVAETGSSVHDLAPGDRVACSGAGYAHHAEYVFVPRQLVVRIPDGLDSKFASFVTLGAIALQGVRRAAIQLGEVAVVVGLGLIGLLTVQILRAAGARVIGVDPFPERASLAQRLGAEQCAITGVGDATKLVMDYTGGHGADAVLLTAGTRSSDPANQAFEMARERSRVVVVGDVGMHLARPTFYRKELDFVISRSTGPGRYDRNYEEGGIDYPIGHVRWTEQRNMDAFLRLLASASVRVGDLIAHEHAIADAATGYRRLAQPGGGIAVLLRYPGASSSSSDAVDSISRRVLLKATPAVKSAATGVAVLGAGAFACDTLLPVLARRSDVRLRAVVTGPSGGGLRQARRFGAEVYSSDPIAVLDDPVVEAVVIATRHDLHVPLALEAVRRGKAVFVEKPLALTVDQCREISQAVAKTGSLLTVGFNRRFATPMLEARALLQRTSGTAIAMCRVNAGPLRPDHWLLDPAQGGPIVGEACHFFDLLCWLLADEPAFLTAMAPLTGGQPNEMVVTMRLARGSLASLIYTSFGNRAVPKERLEVFKGGHVIVVDDCRRLIVDGRRHGSEGRDKGYTTEIDTFMRAVRGEGRLDVTVDDGIRATLLALRAIDSATARLTLSCEWPRLLQGDNT